MTDEEVDENNRRLLKGTQWEDFVFLDNVSKSIIIDAPIEINDIERIILMDGYIRKYVALTQRYNDIGLSLGTGSRLIKGLESKNLIRIHEITLGGRGSNTKFMELTQEAYKAINMKARVGIGRGADFIHGFWQDFLAQNLKTLKGIKKVAIEGNLKGKFIDILLETESGKIAVEIEMSDSHVLENIRKDLDAGVSLIFIACGSRQNLTTIKKMIQTLPDTTRQKMYLCMVQKVISEISILLDKPGGD